MYNTIRIFTTVMRRLLLYIILLVILYSGFNQVKDIWEKNGQSLDATVSRVKENVLGWYGTASEKSKGITEQLKTTIQATSVKYEKIKSDITTINREIKQKKADFEKTLKEMQQAKEDLQKLLGTPEAKTNAVPTPTTPPATPDSGVPAGQAGGSATKSAGTADKPQ